jgi:hypothetical protein
MNGCGARLTSPATAFHDAAGRNDAFRVVIDS